MIKFTKWLKILYESFEPSRGGKNKDWVSQDDYDERTPLSGGVYLKNKHRLAGYQARAKGQDRTTNPNPKNTKAHSDWHNGWDDHHFIHEPKNHEYGAADEPD